MGRILDLARTDAHRILTDMGFQTNLTFIRENKTVVVPGLGIIHHLNFDTDGLAVNAKTCRVSVSEKSLTDAGYVTRNSKNEVYLKDDLVSFADASGIVKQYNVAENFADDSLGTITLVLQRYAPKNNTIPTV